MGADLAYMGTRFINVRESAASDDYKKMIMESSAEDIVYTAAVSGVHANFIKASLESVGITEDRWKDTKKIDETLNLFQSISKFIEKSEVLFISEMNGLVQGPAMEIALSCNFIKAKKDTLLKLDQTNYGIMPFFGTTQRLTRLIGYQNALKAFLIDKKIT